MHLEKHCSNDVIVLYLIEFQIINIMNNLIENYEIILKHLRITCSDIPSFYQKRIPKLSNLELVTVNITAEHMSINTELQLFICFKGACLEPMIERSV